MAGAVLSKRERVLRTVHFADVDRIAVYDILQNNAVIEHYAAAVLQGCTLSFLNGKMATRFAIGRTLDLTRMPDGPAEPGLFRQANGLVVQADWWTSWIVERPFNDVPEMVEWVKGEIRRANETV